MTESIPVVEDDAIDGVPAVSASRPESKYYGEQSDGSSEMRVFWRNEGMYLCVTFILVFSTGLSQVTVTIFAIIVVLKED